jgi:uroporphyrinogen-III synthase
MSADVVRETLKNEAELLDQMMKFVKDVKGDSFTRQAQIIQESWARFLGERKESSEQLSKASDEVLLQDLQQELAQVEQYVVVTRTHPEYTEQWEKFVKCERDILEALIRKIHDGKAAD